MIDFNILGGGSNAGNSFMQGFQQARGIVREQQADNALAQYAQNPDDPAAIGAIARADPRLAFQMRRDQQTRQQQAAAAAQQEQAKKVEAATKTIGNAALYIMRLPPEQRAQAWDQQIDNFVAQGYDGLASMKGRYSDANLQSVLAQAGMSQAGNEITDPRYQAVAPGGELQNTNPYARGTTMGQVAQPTQGPQPGQVEDGYRFKGGNPADPNAWESVGGAPSQGGATFP